MNCRHALGKLQALLDGLLPEREILAARAHLASCQSCLAEWEALCRLDRALEEEPSLDPPASMATQIASEAAARALLRRRVLLPAWLEAITGIGLSAALASLGGTAIELLGGPAALGLTLRHAIAVVGAGAALGLAGFSALYYRPQ